MGESSFCISLAGVFCRPRRADQRNCGDNGGLTETIQRRATVHELRKALSSGQTCVGCAWRFVLAGPRRCAKREPEDGVGGGGLRL